MEWNGRTWTALTAHDKGNSRAVVNTVMNFRVPQRNICCLSEASQGFFSTELVSFLLYTATVSVGKVREINKVEYLRTQ